MWLSRCCEDNNALCTSYGQKVLYLHEKTTLIKMNKSLTINYQEFDSPDELSKADRSLMEHAIAATGNAYAPYSSFHVGAALLLGNGEIVTGSNQENIAYPSGLCAERTAMFAASAQYSGARFEALAVVGRNSDGQLCEASPCGACRQVMIEYEGRQGSPMRIICYLDGGRIRVVEGATNLLPFGFNF